MNYIKSVSINTFEGIFNQTIQFKNGLNIISGVNGTGKTTVLITIKNNISNRTVVNLEGNNPQVIAFSPKRNSEKKTAQTALLWIRQNSKTKETLLQEALSKAVADNAFTAYESLGSLFVYDFEDKGRSGLKPPIEIMNDLTKEYNEIIKDIFPTYKLVSEWKSDLGSPLLKLITRFGIPIDLSVMSCGESEVLALVFNIYSNKEKADIFLIDEPEIHLNWTLEKGLFVFFDKFAKENNKQIIVTTHSRIIFDANFKNSTQYFAVKDNKIYVDVNPPKEYLEEIAGETAAIIATSAPTQKTFFVEDDFHKITIEKLLQIYGKTAETVIIKDASGAIQNFYKVLKSNNEFNNKWVNAYLMIDGDGKEEMYKKEPRFIHLKKYCIESYFFHIDTLMSVLGKKKSTILKELKTNKKIFQGQNSILIKNLINKLNQADLNDEVFNSFDTSELLKRLIQKSRITFEVFIERYLIRLKKDGLMEDVFDKKLLDAIKA